MASWIPEITELAGNRCKYGGEYKRERRRQDILIRQTLETIFDLPFSRVELLIENKPFTPFDLCTAHKMLKYFIRSVHNILCNDTFVPHFWVMNLFFCLCSSDALH